MRPHRVLDSSTFYPAWESALPEAFALEVLLVVVRKL